MNIRLRSLLLAAFGLLAFTGVASAQITSSRNLTFHANKNDSAQVSGYSYSSCWGYVHGDGREYAVIGTRRGTLIYNVTDVNNVYWVGFIPGKTSTWREMKSYRNWIYVTTEAYSSGSPWDAAVPVGLQIIRMTDPEHPVLAATYAGTFNRSHSVSIDTTRALLICNGTNLYTPPSSQQKRGLRVLSLVNPEAPSEVGLWPSTGYNDANYVHDCVPVGNRIFASSVYAGTERVLDFTNPAAITEIASWTYPNAFYTHNAWPDSSGNYLYVTDEQNGQTLRVFDISSLGSPDIAYELTSNPNSIVHNAHVKGHELYLANYTEGTRVLDISDPAHPAEFAFSDSYPGPSGGYSGVWGVYPYFPSGTVISSDMQTGLYVYRPVRDYGIVRVRVTDAGNSQPISGVTVHLTSQGDSLTTTADGVVVFAPSPGNHTVEVRRFGYHTATAGTALAAGERDTIELAMVQRPLATYDGTVRDAATSNPLFESHVTLAYTPLTQHTDVNGEFSFTGVVSDRHLVQVQASGHIPISFEREINADITPSQDIELLAAPTWETFEGVGSWLVGALGDAATSGIWVRTDPLGTGLPGPHVHNGDHLIGRGTGPEGIKPLPQLFHGSEESGGTYPGEVQPENDHTPLGTTCWVTGQGTTPESIDEADVDGGTTTLTSPAFNLTSMSDPVIGYWRWFYGDGGLDDYLNLEISPNNGTNWYPVKQVTGVQNEWVEEAIHVAQYIAPSTQTKIRFIAHDGVGAPSVVEVAIDDVILYDGATPAVGVGPGAAPARLAFRTPWPNPARGEVRLTLALPAAGRADVEVVDLAGRRIATLHRGVAPAGSLALRWDGRDESGSLAPAGVYYARARTAGGVAETRFVRLR